MAVDQRIRTNQEDKQQTRQHAITTQLQSGLRGQGTSDLTDYRKKSRPNSGRNPAGNREIGAPVQHGESMT
jgi:cytochrome c553